ncbi:uncharacterized protein LOC131092863 [Melospiza georgiana]|uniref:uncharacterized protein LOC131092863 n=1 Tax=Melospiza georgiana TaxID=44398 RepID=UPI0025AC9252|nr:uncharacterized protein LOC131092863 [Melospiza georgiana]
MGLGTARTEPIPTTTHRPRDTRQEPCESPSLELGQDGGKGCPSTSQHLPAFPSPRKAQCRIWDLPPLPWLSPRRASCGAAPMELRRFQELREPPAGQAQPRSEFPAARSAVAPSPGDRVPPDSLKSRSKNVVWAEECAAGKGKGRREARGERGGRGRAGSALPADLTFPAVGGQMWGLHPRGISESFRAPFLETLRIPYPTRFPQDSLSWSPSGFHFLEFLRIPFPGDPQDSHSPFLGVPHYSLPWSPSGFLSMSPSGFFFLESVRVPFPPFLEPLRIPFPGAPQISLSWSPSGFPFLKSLRDSLS